MLAAPAFQRTVSVLKWMGRPNGLGGPRERLENPLGGCVPCLVFGRPSGVSFSHTFFPFPLPSVYGNTFLLPWALVGSPSMSSFLVFSSSEGRAYNGGAASVRDLKTGFASAVACAGGVEDDLASRAEGPGGLLNGSVAVLVEVGPVVLRVAEEG